MSWKFIEGPKPGTETALDACDYFVDEVIENSGGMGAAHTKQSHRPYGTLIIQSAFVSYRCARGGASDKAWRAACGG